MSQVAAPMTWNVPVVFRNEDGDEEEFELQKARTNSKSEARQIAKQSALKGRDEDEWELDIKSPYQI